MNLHVAFYSREFRLCEWPEKPIAPKSEDYEPFRIAEYTTKTYEFFQADRKYKEAVTSAMENGVAFDPQEPIRNYILTNHSDWDIVFPQNGQNWPAPQEAMIERQGWGLSDLSGKYSWGKLNNPDFVGQIRQVAVLSESVEKKESVMSDEIFQIIDSDFDNFPLPICFEPREEQQQLYGREQRLKRIAKSIADRLNQSTPKE